jgi:predicted transcriptional regulator
MKNSTLPSLRVDSQLREAAQSVLREGETLSALLETAIRETIHRRQQQDAFIARGLTASNDAQTTGVYYAAKSVHDELQSRLDAKRRTVRG